MSDIDNPQDFLKHHLHARSHAMELDDQALQAFFDYVDERYFNDGSWASDDKDYGVCTRCNSAPLKCLAEAGHSVELCGCSNDAFRGTGLRDTYDLETGHDWLFVDKRWLIDIWAKFYLQTPKAVYDLRDPRDAELVTDLYPPQSFWEINKLLPSGASSHAAHWGRFGDQDWREFKKQYNPAQTKVDEMLF